MGRDIKRVPMDFDWEIGKKWDGYLNPYYVECPDCKGCGATTALNRLNDLVNLIMLSGSDSLRGSNHPYFYNMEGLYHGDDGCPGKEMAELTQGLSGRKSSGFGHDSCDRYTAVKKIINAAGLSEEWGWCKKCNGDGIHPEYKERYETWEEHHPPIGEGWQMWETISEGSPISPVFKTPEELATWMSNADNGRWCGGRYEAWIETIMLGGCVSGMMVDDVMLKGEDVALYLKEKKEGGDA